MSTTLLELEHLGPAREADQADLLTVTSFYGGIGRGRCLQLSCGPAFVQLGHAQVAALSDCLREWLREDEGEILRCRNCAHTGDSHDSRGCGVRGCDCAATLLPRPAVVP